jgi:hypothetical protein
MRKTLLIVVLAGCSGTIGAPTDPASNTGPTSPPSSRTPHIMPKQGTYSAQAAQASAHLTYHGGSVIDHIQVTPIFWNSSSNFQNELPKFYADVTNSAYMDWLSEYDTGSHSLGRGAASAGFVDSQKTKGTIDDSAIQTYITNLVASGNVPAPTADSYYPIYFPPGMTITMQGSSSCVQFCAYHGTTTGNVKYGVIPDIGSGGCESGCGSSGSTLNNTTSVSSHEMIETNTDPGVGQNDIGWYDDTNGEIGDICNAQLGSANGWTVQLEWSNAQKACVDHVGSSGGGTPPPPPPPTCQYNCSDYGYAAGQCYQGWSCDAQGQCLSFTGAC